jgi:hypothetical protein
VIRRILMPPPVVETILAMIDEPNQRFCYSSPVQLVETSELGIYDDSVLFFVQALLFDQPKPGVFEVADCTARFAEGEHAHESLIKDGLFGLEVEHGGLVVAINLID